MRAPSSSTTAIAISRASGSPSWPVWESSGCCVSGSGGARRCQPSAVLVGGAALVVLTLSLATWNQTQVWRDSETLWRWAVEMDPACSLCHGNLGAAIDRHRAGPGPPRRGRGAPAPGHRAPTRQSHPSLQPRHPPVGPDAVRRSGSSPPGIPRARARIANRPGTARASLPAPGPPRGCGAASAAGPRPATRPARRSREDQPEPSSRRPSLSWKTTPARSRCWGERSSSRASRWTRSSL